jgi:hypothetical protein
MRFIFCFILLFLSACSVTPEKSTVTKDQLKSKLNNKLAGGQATYFVHDDHGKVILPNIDYSQDVMSCEKVIYGRGVMIGGQKTIDEDRINEYRKNYAQWKVTLVLDVLSGKDKNSLVFPEKFNAAQLLDDEVRQCLSDSGWSEVVEKTSVSQEDNGSSVFESIVEKVIDGLLKN